MLLSVSGVSKAFGTDIVLEGIDLRLDRREKVGLVGRNGSGKSTLLKIIVGNLEPDTGSVLLGRGVKVGMLRQESSVDPSRTVLEEAQSGVEERLALAARLRALEEAMDSESVSEEDLDEYAMLHEHFLEGEGYAVENDVRTVLSRMGFSAAEFSKPTSVLSGGERTRLALARLLLEEPDLLILDEPTNHLDLQATEWLEKWICGYHGSVLLVSHDRIFLHNTVGRILDLEECTIKTYPGPFEKFVELKKLETERRAEVARRQQAEIAKLDEYVRRFMNSQRTAQARGRLKRMNKLIADRETGPSKQKGMAAGFGKLNRSGDLVVSAESLAIGFDDRALLEDFDWTVRLGDRWGVIGENGSGKSTLIKTILGKLEPRAGRVRIGAGVEVGYFAQDTEDLDLEQSPLDAMVFDLDMEPQSARDLLGRFLIGGEDVYRPARTLSGGEKNKLQLAMLTQMRPNLLVLDEPTNHLDMASRDALVDLLKEYPGTLILISHDRWLLSQVTDNTLDLRGRTAHRYPGSYAEYREWLAKGSPSANARAKTDMPQESKPATMSPRELSKEIQKLERTVADIEGRIGSLEQEIKQLEDRLSRVTPSEDVVAMSREYRSLQEELEGTLAAWEEQSARLESLRQMQ